MRAVIVPTKNVVLIDGKPQSVDCSMLDQSIHVIELGEKRGVIEYINDRDVEPAHFRHNEVFTDFGPYQPLLDAWKAADAIPPAPPVPPKIDPPPRPPMPPEIQAMFDRATTFIVDPDRKALIDRIKDATPAQIKSYINANVTDLASAKVVLTQLALILALVVMGERKE